MRSAEVLLLTSGSEDPSWQTVVCRVVEAAGPAVRHRSSSDDLASLSTEETEVAAIVVSEAAAAIVTERNGGPLVRPGSAGVPVMVVTTRPDDPVVLRVAVDLGASSVVALDDELGLLQRVRAARDLAARGDVLPGRVLTVQSLVGGAGASCLAASLALEAARTARLARPAHASRAGRRPTPSSVTSTRGAVLVDGDPLGAVELALGHPWSGPESAGDLPGWTRLADLDGQVDPDLLLDRLPGEGHLRVVGHGAGDRVPPPSQRLVSVARAGAGAGALVVVDLPRHRDISVGQVDHALWVVPCTVPGVEAAGRRVRELAHPSGTARASHAGRAMHVPAPRRWIVARRARAGLHPHEVAETLGLPLAAVIDQDSRLDEHVALGLGVAPRRRSPYARAARAVWSALEELPGSIR